MLFHFRASKRTGVSDPIIESTHNSVNSQYQYSQIDYSESQVQDVESQLSNTSSDVSFYCLSEMARYPPSIIMFRLLNHPGMCAVQYVTSPNHDALQKVTKHKGPL